MTRDPPRATMHSTVRESLYQNFPISQLRNHRFHNLESNIMSETTQTAAINANFDKTVDAKEFNFRFKKDKLGNQRSPVKLTVGVPSVEGIIAILEKGGKELELLQDALYDVLQGVLRGYVADNEDAAQDKIDLTKFTWEAIANQPREDRRSATISEEQWAGFAADYAAIMPGVSGKTTQQVGNAVEVYLKKLTQVKTNKPVLKALEVQLGLYLDNSPNAANFEDVLEFLTRRLENYLKADDVEALISNL